jgi:hypothetical protein
MSEAKASPEEDCITELARCEEAGGSLEFWEKLAAFRHKDTEEARAEQELRQRIRAESEKYLFTPVSQWPEMRINWDLSRESQRFSLDGYALASYSKPRFDRDHPEGFILGWVPLLDFDAKLCASNHRTEEELWTVGRALTVAELIVYLSEGRPISPPAVRVADSEICLLGGNHRYAVAKAIGETELPIHALPGQRDLLESLLPVTWV